MGWRVAFVAKTIPVLDAEAPGEEIPLMIGYAYDVVMSKLPKYIQRELRSKETP